MKTSLAIALLGLLCGATARAQQKHFEWQPANDESVQLDPAYYHAGRVYHPSPAGGIIHIDVESAMAVTVAMVREAEWRQTMLDEELLHHLHFICRQERVVKATYTCQIPGEPMVLIIRDERNSPERAVSAGLGTRFVAPNDLHIQYYRWACVANCNPPEFQWIPQFKEKYDVTSSTKIYGGLLPERDGETVSVKINSPLPMLVAIIPSQMAAGLGANPNTLEQALRQNSCQQRGVRSLTFECTFNVTDGPQSLVVVPEAGQEVSRDEKAEIEVYATKCVANCTLLAAKKVGL